MLTSFLNTLSTVFTTYIPALATGIYQMFVNLFCTTATEGGAVTGLNELGILATAIIAVGIVSGIVGVVMHVLRLRGQVHKARRAI